MYIKIVCNFKWLLYDGSTGFAFAFKSKLCFDIFLKSYEKDFLFHFGW